jgi:hypothetical protein
VGPPGSPALQRVRGEAWDWSSSSWVEISYQENGTTALPDGSVNPSTGTVRVRITPGSDGFVAGSLSLSGTVR